MIRELIRLNLELEGFEVFTAVDGQDCLDRVGYIDPHVVTLDVMMPRLDGWTTAERLREDHAAPRRVLILVTARAQEEDHRRGDGIGVDAYLTKPFDPDVLIDTIRELIAAEGGQR